MVQEGGELTQATLAYFGGFPLTGIDFPSREWRSVCQAASICFRIFALLGASSERKYAVRRTLAKSFLLADLPLFLLISPSIPYEKDTFIGCL